MEFSELSNSHLGGSRVVEVTSRAEFSLWG
jgi:hypothetical protein